MSRRLIECSNKKKISAIAIFFLLLVVTMIITFPLWVAFFTSFKVKSDVITVNPHIFPTEITLDNYKRLIFDKDIFMYIKNSFIVATFLMIVTVVLSLLGAFAIVWLKFPGKRAFVKMILGIYMLPTLLFAMPYYVMCNALGLLNSSIGLIITYLSFTLPFAIWMLKNSFETIPVELLESGLIDGCSYTQCLYKIVLPISLPAVSVTAVYGFIVGFSEYMFASTLMTEEKARTMPLFLSLLMGRYHTDFGILTAASMLMILPIIILYLIVQRYFIAGMTSGAVKD